MAKILVLDDILDAGNLLKRILNTAGHDVVVFTEEEEALDYARVNTIALAILDIKLKKMTGVEVLEELKNIDPAMKAIMLTGYPTMETAQRALQLGASEYCVKPIDKEELEEKVAQVLSEQHTADGGAANPNIS
jgi:DNA-binding NtrC family response regulator